MSFNRQKIPPLSCLVMFESAARLGSITQASKELFVSPTAVSKQLKNLETSLNMTLLHRSKQGVELSVDGKRYYKKVVEALTILASECEPDLGHSNKNELDLEVGLCFLHFWLLPRLDDFRKAHPDIQLNLSVNNDYNVGMDDSQYDIAFYYSQVDGSNKHNYLVFHERMQLVCSPAFLEQQGGKIDLQQVFDLPLIMLKNERPNWEGWQSWSKQLNLDYHKPRQVLKVNDQVAVIQAALNNAGLALAWDWQIRDHIQQGQLICVSQTIEFPNKAYFLTIAPHCHTPSAKQFINWVLAQEQSEYPGAMFPQQ
ncbi:MULTISPECIES: LysR substrate-binding domain-containing protein [unclassified Vibrio]|uniref:LysR substrate-binding domain-containing protein n=1 Tax=Vibrio sp. HB236076 TaxID=3232307 RepID=A0AB39HFY3_9VIBR|nr:LysR substrate-binding domain-containing protein [Vibrio sp. HB161653]MDP5253131.1 LysR substrate-binding domain-containing protein [Vibrio sp. HB161653]